MRRILLAAALVLTASALTPMGAAAGSQDPLKPITGSHDPTSAPLVEQGEWRANFPSAGTTTYYRISRSDTGSTVHAGVHFVAPDGTTNSGETISLFVLDPTAEGGQYVCDTQAITTLEVASGSPLSTGAVTTARPGAPAACTSAPDVFLAVSTPSGVVRLGNDMHLEIYEEPSGRNPTTTMSGSTQRWSTLAVADTPDASVEAGTNFSTAPVITPGSYTFSLRPGTYVLAVPVDWGQQVQVLVTAEFSAATAAAAAPGFSPEVDVISPVGEVVSSAVSPRPSTWTRTPWSDQVTWTQPEWSSGALSAPVTAQNADTLPGIHWIVVRMPSTTAVPDSFTVTVALPETATTPPTYAASILTEPGATFSPNQLNPIHGPDPTVERSLDANNSVVSTLILLVGSGILLGLGLWAGTAAARHQQRRT